MITSNIIRTCVNSLLDPESEDKLECMCKLLTTVGAKFDDGSKQKNFNIDATFRQISNIVEKKSEKEQKISSRVRFMLQDVLDLRRNKWIPVTGKVEGPKTMDQIQKDVKSEQISVNLLSLSGTSTDLNNGRRGQFQRRIQNNLQQNQSQLNENDEWHVISKNNRSIDANKLEPMLNSDISADIPKLGSSSQFTMWNTGSNQNFTSMQTSNSFAALSYLDNSKDLGKSTKNSDHKNSIEKEKNFSNRSNSRTNSIHSSRDSSSSRNVSVTKTTSSHSSDVDSQFGTKFVYQSNPPPVIFEELESENQKLIISAIKKIMEEYFDSMNFHNCINIFLEFSEKLRWAFIFLIFYEYLHLSKLTSTYRELTAEFIIFLLDNHLISMEHFNYGYRFFSSIASDLLLDVPDAWHYIFQCAIILIQRKTLKLNDLWNEDLKQSNMGSKFLKEYINQSVKHIGPSYTRKSWITLNLDWKQFLEEDQIEYFIQSNKFEFINDDTKHPEIIINGSLENHIQNLMVKIKGLLQTNYCNDEIIDFLRGNIPDINKKYIQSLTTTLCEFAILQINKNYKLDSERFKSAMYILQCFLDSKADRELETLYSLQLLNFNLEQPPGLLSQLFSELYYAEVIPPDSFLEWRDSKEYQSAGKGVAVMGLRNFFDEVETIDTSDEDK